MSKYITRKSVGTTRKRFFATLIDDKGQLTNFHLMIEKHKGIMVRGISYLYKGILFEYDKRLFYVPFDVAHDCVTYQDPDNTIPIDSVFIVDRSEEKDEKYYKLVPLVCTTISLVCAVILVAIGMFLG